jgi:hypothetical protein
MYHTTIQHTPTHNSWIDPDSNNQRTAAADGTNINREVQREQRSREERAAWQNIMQNYNYYQRFVTETAW